MAEHKERLARAMTREMGKVLAEARGDVQEGIDIAYLMAGEGRRMFGDTVPVRAARQVGDEHPPADRRRRDHHALELPDGDPVLEDDAGARHRQHRRVQAVASDTPHCATLLVELMAEAGFPPGVVNLVTGAGGEVGDAIVDSPDVAVISFTGISATGKRDRRAGRPRGSSASRLELGGKNGVVVLADADLDLATDGILWSAFGTTGQRCTACSRVIVERAGRRAAARAARGARRASSGSAPASTDDVDVGPLINAGARRQGRVVRRRSGAARASSSSAAAGATDGDLAARPLLRADDLRRRRADGPDRPGGDLRAGPVGHPGRRLRRRR